jgi:hypothetical protein
MKELEELKDIHGEEKMELTQEEKIKREVQKIDKEIKKIREEIESLEEDSDIENFIELKNMTRKIVFNENNDEKEEEFKFIF